MLTEQLAQPQSMHRRAQRAPIRTLFGPGTEARKPLSGYTGVSLVTRGNGLFRQRVEVLLIAASNFFNNRRVTSSRWRHTIGCPLSISFDPCGAAIRQLSGVLLPHRGRGWYSCP